MNQRAGSCCLKSIEDSLLSVHLPDQKAIFVGRCQETNIIDIKCSRQQVRLYADYAEYKVFVQQVGKRSSCFNGFKTSKGVRFIAKHNDNLEILYGKYSYRIEFDPPPVTVSTQLGKKRSIESEMDIEAKENCSKIMKYNACDMTDDEKNKEQVQEEETDISSIAGCSKDTNNTMLVQDSTKPLPAQMLWKRKDDLIMYTSNGAGGRSKIAAFDMDGTLIKTRSGLVFPKDYDDWQLLYPDVPGKLKKLHEDGYKVVIFTNQGGIGTGRLDPSKFELKIQKIRQRINVPMQVYIATGPTIYRKPAIGMWQALEEHNDNIPIDKSKSFYVGDAAGRPKNWAPGKKKDHSCADRLMALNLGLRFQTPEEYFLGCREAPYVLPKFKPMELSNSTEVCKAGSKITSDKLEVILMVGCPGSGKSHFAKYHLRDYGYVNRDTLRSWQKCIDAIDDYLTKNKSVVVDNTNADRATRQKYLGVAVKHKVPVRCFVMSTSIQHAKHNNKFREFTDETHAKIGDATINFYVKNYQPPSMEEGFAEIVQVNFVPKFQNENERKLYEMYLLEN